MTSLTVGSVLALLLVLLAHLQLATCSPALLWSSHIDGTKDMVDYRTLSPRELAKSVMSEGGWSDYLCSEKEAHQSRSFAFLFIGTELQSAADIARPKKADQTLVGLLKDSFSNSNHSLAFPYVAGQEENMAIESSLISEFANSCQRSPVISNVAVMGSCLVDGEHFDNLEDYQSVHDYMHSRMEKNPQGHTDLIVLCRVGSHLKQDSDQSHSEVGVISQLLSSVKQLGAKYSFLYVSDPSSRRPLERFLAEGSIGNGTVNSTACDGVCQIKSSLLEGLFVGIVLLVILISGLCCMAGIDTPTRFETPQDS